MTDRRKAAATAGVGYGLVGSGGVLRGHAIDEAHHELGIDHRVVPPSLAVYGARRWRVPRSGRIAGKWGAGTALVALGAPAAATGTRDLFRRRRTTVGKRERRNYLAEGVEGSTDALRDKAEGFRSGAPARVRAIPIGVGTVAGAGGSLTAHRALDLIARRRRVPGHLRSGLTAAAAVPAVVASLPLSRRLTRKAGYEPQPSGGLRRIGKAEPVYRGPDYLGRHVTRGQQRLRVYAAGGAPVVGPVAQVRQAGRYAPPGHERAAMTRQALGGPGAALAGGVGGAYGGAALAHRSQRIAGQAHRAWQASADAKHRALSAVGLAHGDAPKVGGDIPRALRPIAARRALRPLVGSKARIAGAAVGYVAGKTIAGQVGGNVAINRNYTAQRRYDSHRMRRVHKADVPLTDRQARTLARRKRRSAVMSVLAGSAGLTGLGLQIASRRPHLHPDAAARMLAHRDTAVTVGAGIGGLNALTNAAIQRREAKVIRSEVGKRSRDPLHTTLTDEEAQHLVHGHGGYGLTGTLPHQLDRKERMRAYEARYLAAGGRKSEKWNRRARGAEVARNVGVAGATASGAAWLAAGSPHLRHIGRAVARGRLAHATSTAVKHRAERAAVAAGTLGGAAELGEEYARHRRAAYTSAPGGVAASNLRRMQAYS